MRGASRTTGGVFRGRALGNAPNAADLRGIDEAEPLSMKGIVNIFTAHSMEDASQILVSKPISTIKVKVTYDSNELVEILMKRKAGAAGTFNSYIMFYILIVQIRANHFFLRE